MENADRCEACQKEIPPSAPQCQVCGDEGCCPSCGHCGHCGRDFEGQGPTFLNVEPSLDIGGVCVNQFALGFRENLSPSPTRHETSPFRLTPPPIRRCF